LGALCLSLAAAFKYGAPAWAIGVLFCFIGVILIGYLAAYGYLFLKKPELLQTENYTLKKMIIERGLTGDTLGGIFDPEIPTNRILGKANESVAVGVRGQE
jgi:fructose-specific phosphotransferase system IIC component